MLQNELEKLRKSNEVEMQFFSKWKYKKFFIYCKDKVVSEYYHTLLAREWIDYKKNHNEWIQDSIIKKLQDSKLMDVGITCNVLSFLDGKTKEFYEIDCLDDLYFDSFEVALWFLAFKYVECLKNACNN